MIVDDQQWVETLWPTKKHGEFEEVMENAK